MNYRLDPDFVEKLKRLKKQNVRIHKAFWDSLAIFEKDENDPRLDNKQLTRELKDYWRIVISKDNKYAAMYRKIEDGDEVITKFFHIGHKRYLYKRNEEKERTTKE